MAPKLGLADVDNRAVRLYRCRNLKQLFDPKDNTYAPTFDVSKRMASMPVQAKLGAALAHFRHRAASVQATMDAYMRWAEIADKPPNERLPGEEHYSMCMEAFEQRFEPFKRNGDYEMDASIMLFDQNMEWHNEAAQALIALEETRRLREERLSHPQPKRTPTNAAAGPPVLRIPANIVRESHRKRNESGAPPANPFDDDAMPPPAKRSRAQRSVTPAGNLRPVVPSVEPEVIAADAGL